MGKNAFDPRDLQRYLWVMKGVFASVGEWGWPRQRVQRESLTAPAGGVQALTTPPKRSGPVRLSSPNRATESPESCKMRSRPSSRAPASATAGANGGTQWGGRGASPAAPSAAPPAAKPKLTLPPGKHHGCGGRTKSSEGGTTGQISPRPRLGERREAFQRRQLG